jgi:hypothetical protein
MKSTRINIAIVLAVLLAGINHRAIAEKIQGWWDFAEQSSLTNPASGYRRLAFKSDGKLYSRSSAGVEAEIGAGGGSVDLSNPANFKPVVEDFINGTATSNQVGEYGWSISTYGSGTADVNSTPMANVPGHAGGVAHSTNADSGAVLALHYVDSTMVTGYDWTWKARVKLASTSNSRTWLGIGASAAVVPARFLGFRYDTSSSYADDTKNTTGRWVAQMCVSSGCSDTGGTYVVTSVQPSTNWVLLEMSKSSSTYTFKIDGTTRATFCASGCDATVTAMNGFANQAFLTFCFESGASFTGSYADWFYFGYGTLSR